MPIFETSESRIVRHEGFQHIQTIMYALINKNMKETGFVVFRIMATFGPQLYFAPRRANISYFR